MGLRNLGLGCVVAMGVAGGAQAACYVEYKAKQDNPLRLHYGIIELPDAECGAPQQAVARRIQAGGWTLLSVMGLLSAGEAEARRADAGEFYLRY